MKGDSSSNVPQRAPGFGNQFSRQEEKKPGLEEILLKNFEEMQLEMRSMSQRNEKTIDDHTRRLNVHDTTLRNIEVQLGQLTQDIHKRPQGGLPSDMVANPKGKEQCCAITLNSRTNKADVRKKLCE